MSDRLALRDVDRLQRAERRWLDQARERLRSPVRTRALLPPDPMTPLDPEETHP
jgi:hypothetical protein